MSLYEKYSISIKKRDKKQFKNKIYKKNMTKNFKTIAILLIAATTIFSCKKDELIKKNQSPINQVLTETSTGEEIIAAVDDFNQWISNKKKVLSLFL